MKSKVIIFCALLFCSKFVASIPFEEELSRQRAYPPSNWQGNKNTADHYHGTDFARTQPNTMNNGQEYNVNQGRQRFENYGFNNNPLTMQALPMKESQTKFAPDAIEQRPDNFATRVDPYPNRPDNQPIRADNEPQKKQTWQAPNQFANVVASASANIVASPDHSMHGREPYYDSGHIHTQGRPVNYQHFHPDRPPVRDTHYHPESEQPQNKYAPRPGPEFGTRYENHNDANQPKPANPEYVENQSYSRPANVPPYEAYDSSPGKPVGNYLPQPAPSSSNSYEPVSHTIPRNPISNSGNKGYAQNAIPIEQPSTEPRPNNAIPYNAPIPPSGTDYDKPVHNHNTYNHRSVNRPPANSYNGPLVVPVEPIAPSNDGNQKPTHSFREERPKPVETYPAHQVGNKKPTPPGPVNHYNDIYQHISSPSDRTRPNLDVLPHLKNILSSNVNRYTMIHPNGTVQRFDNLDHITPNNPNYILVKKEDQKLVEGSRRRPTSALDKDFLDVLAKQFGNDHRQKSVPFVRKEPTHQPPTAKTYNQPSQTPINYGYYPPAQPPTSNNYNTPKPPTGNDNYSQSKSSTGNVRHPPSRPPTRIDNKPSRQPPIVNNNPQSPTGNDYKPPPQSPSGNNNKPPPQPPTGNDNKPPTPSPTGKDQNPPPQPPTGSDNKPPPQPPTGNDQNPPSQPPTGNDNKSPPQSPTGNEQNPPSQPPTGNENKPPPQSPTGNDQNPSPQPPTGNDYDLLPQYPSGNDFAPPFIAQPPVLKRYDQFPKPRKPLPYYTKSPPIKKLNHGEPITTTISPVEALVEEYLHSVQHDTLKNPSPVPADNSSPELVYLPDVEDSRPNDSSRESKTTPPSKLHTVISPGIFTTTTRPSKLHTVISPGIYTTPRPYPKLHTIISPGIYRSTRKPNTDNKGKDSTSTPHHYDEAHTTAPTTLHPTTTEVVIIEDFIGSLSEYNDEYPSGPSKPDDTNPLPKHPEGYTSSETQSPPVTESSKPYNGSTPTTVTTTNQFVTISPIEKATDNVRNVSTEKPKKPNSDDKNNTKSTTDIPKAQTTMVTTKAPNTTNTTKAPNTTDTTKVPTTTNTTKAPTTENITKVPPTTNTTKAPNNTNTTKVPTTPSTTKAPNTTNTTKAPTTPSTTKAPNTTNTTKAPTTPGTTKAPTSTTPTTYEYVTNTDVPNSPNVNSAVATNSTKQSDVKTGDTPTTGDNLLKPKPCPTELKITLNVPDASDGNITIHVDDPNSSGNADPSKNKTLILNIEPVNKYNITDRTAATQFSTGTTDTDPSFEELYLYKNLFFDLSNKTTDTAFYEHLTDKQNGSLNIFYIFQVQPAIQPIIEKNKETTTFPNGTVVIETVETTWKNQNDTSPTVITSKKVFHKSDKL